MQYVLVLSNFSLQYLGGVGGRFTVQESIPLSVTPGLFKAFSGALHCNHLVLVKISLAFTPKVWKKRNINYSTVRDGRKLPLVIAIARSLVAPIHNCGMAFRIIMKRMKRFHPLAWSHNDEGDNDEQRNLTKHFTSLESQNPSIDIFV